MHFLLSDSTLIKTISTDSRLIERSRASTVACLTPTAFCIALMVFLNSAKRRGDGPGGGGGFDRWLCPRVVLALKAFAASIVENVRLPLFDMSGDNVF